MKIAFIGIRGIPVVYSGFETMAEELAVRLTERGHHVTVYCRQPYLSYKKRFYRGVKLLPLPVVFSKNWETFVHSFMATIHAVLMAKYELIFYIGVGSAVFSLVPRLFGVKTVVHVDGLDWKREKWGPVGRTYLALSEFIACIFPNATLTDSRFIKDYYQKKFHREIYAIPYGPTITKKRDNSILKKLGLKKNQYFFASGRLVPDNHFDEAIKAFLRLKLTQFKLVVAGDNLIEKEYKDVLMRLIRGNQRIIFTGFLDRPRCMSLLANAYCYLETKRSGGIHPSLTEALEIANLILANNHPAHQEVLNGGAVYYRPGNVLDLVKKLRFIIKPSFKTTIRVLKQKRVRQIKEKFNWTSVSRQYDELFVGLVDSGHGKLL